MQPSVGRIVHYNHDGTCRAAIITQADGATTLLTVFQPFGPQAMLDAKQEGNAPGTWHWPERT
ncbi:hypothetical protein ACIOC1_00330 [Streptomyces sp. NPDC088197]|uniref:hypothetical protein n=1 Tax=Streptomyces sp. NPDC088197 TaxID=3365840 RepID=UPI003824C6B4